MKYEQYESSDGPIYMYIFLHTVYMQWIVCHKQLQIMPVATITNASCQLILFTVLGMALENLMEKLERIRCDLL